MTDAPETHRLTDEHLWLMLERLIGPVHPIGETTADGRALENLKLMTRLADRFVMEIHEVTRYAGSRYLSMKKAGELAQSFIKMLEDYRDE